MRREESRNAKRWASLTERAAPRRAFLPRAGAGRPQTAAAAACGRTQPGARLQGNWWCFVTFSLGFCLLWPGLPEQHSGAQPHLPPFSSPPPAAAAAGDARRARRRPFCAAWRPCGGQPGERRGRGAGEMQRGDGEARHRRGVL